MKKGLYSVALLFALSRAHAAWAQGGCINSPENPTVVLGVVGSAGALLVSLRRSRR